VPEWKHPRSSNLDISLKAAEPVAESVNSGILSTTTSRSHPSLTAGQFGRQERVVSQCGEGALTINRSLIAFTAAGFARFRS
jgi:hypothetical protein